MQEYQNLCNKLDLKPVPLDVYEYKEDSNEKTDLSTSKNNATAGYSPDKLILPLTGEGTSSLREPSFPPKEWNKLHPMEWPVWRVELWHEVVHQVEDQILNKWSPLHNHGNSWSEAIRYVAKEFSVEPETIERLM
ncbi:hypothetical protein LX73_0160 [Fodinibius salinus]|uniref:Uncharacterized protein n=1 Tax=Fodinibius salinus TaxID=860790 RepID=A0A5D3YLV5_9BACT|nr:hypothetical protein [Fodinibius salinus]TYP94870.1 hypothetical protein LX73_0160 [Fodinibius salinus]